MTAEKVKYKGAYLGYYYFRKGKVSGQIAVLMTLLIAVIFLFITITINIGQIGFLRTTVSNAADGAMLTLASNVGSYSQLLSRQTGGGGFSWTSAIRTAIGLVMLCHAPTAPAGAVMLAMQMYQETITQQQIASANQKLRNLPIKLQFREGAVQYALFKAVFDDPMKVVDSTDSDDDGDTTEKVPFFGVWYTKRADELRKYQQELQGLISGFGSSLETFFVDVAGYQIPSVGMTPGRFIPGHLNYLEGNFVTELSGIEGNGFELTFYDGSESDEVSVLVDDMQYFVDCYSSPITTGFLGTSFASIDSEALAITFDTWFSAFYDENTGSDWYDRIGDRADDPSTADVEKGWDKMIEEWIVELGEKKEEAGDAVIYILVPGGGPMGANSWEIWLLSEYIAGVISSLENIQADIETFRIALAGFATNVIALEEKYHGAFNVALYSWKDNRGWHHVKVKVGDFNLPYLRIEKDWFHDAESILENGSGSLSIKVARYDEDNQQVYFAKKDPNVEPAVALWKFRYRKSPDQTPSDSYSLDSVIDTDGDGYITTLDLSTADRDMINNRIDNYGIVSKTDGSFSNIMSGIKITSVN